MENIKKVVIIRTLLGQVYADYIAKEINLKGLSCSVVVLKDLGRYLKEHNYHPKDTIIHSRTASPDYTYKKLNNFKKRGYRIINNLETIKLTSHKFNSCVHAIQHDIPCAEIIKVNKEDIVLEAKEKIKDWKKIIVKPITSQGQGEFCFKFDKNNFEQIKRTKKTPVQELIIQKFVGYKRLSRVIVVGSKALEGAVFYDKPGKGWKCSVCLNPNIKHYKTPPGGLLKFAENVARKFNAEITFIDIFTTNKGYVLNEINTACSLTLHERLSGYNISKKIAEYLLNCF